MIRQFFKVTRRGDRVEITIDSMMAVDCPTFAIGIQCARELDATLLAAHFRDELERLVCEARQKAYAAGYRDGRAKRGKAKWQSGHLGASL